MSKQVIEFGNSWQRLTAIGSVTIPANCVTKSTEVYMESLGKDPRCPKTREMSRNDQPRMDVK